MTVRDAVFRLLKGLPLVRFALMLGGGMVATSGGVWLIAVLAHGRWLRTEAADIARINVLGMLGIGCLVLIGIVLVALAWGQLDKVKVSVGGNEVEADFGED